MPDRVLTNSKKVDCGVNTDRERGLHMNREKATESIFPMGLACNEWIQFLAAGFSERVCGIIYSTRHLYSSRDRWMGLKNEEKNTGITSFHDAHPPAHGMPIGAIDTGCLDLDVNGTFGFCTIFNTHVPRRVLNLPFLGVSVGGQSWVLTTPEIPGRPTMSHYGEGAAQESRHADQIHYWGHYPVADLEYEIGAPVSVGLRAWTPFLPGDIDNSITPGAVFEVHLRNVKDVPQQGTVAFGFPGPSREEAEGAESFPRQVIKGTFSGVHVTNGSDIGYALGVAGDEKFRTGGDLGTNREAWANIANKLPDATEKEPGASVSVNFSLKPGENKVVRFILSWHSPRWKSGGTPTSGGNTYTHMYTTRYDSALEAAQLLAEKHESLLKRVLAWQQVVYKEEKLPVWLRELLVNILHLITEDSFWAVAKPPIEDWCRPEDGLFGMLEDPRTCPQIECLPCSFYGNIPVVYFFPNLALSTLRGYKGYQNAEGAPPFGFGHGAPCEMGMPVHGAHLCMNGPSYVDLVDRYWLCTGDDKVLREFYPSVKKAVIFNVKHVRSGADGIISVSKSDTGYGVESFEHCQFFGMAAHAGGMRLAMLRMAGRMAEKAGDQEFVRQCNEWLSQGTNSMETKMWAERYYLNYCDLETGKTSDLIHAYQLDGEWMTHFHDLPNVFRKERVKTTLATIKEANVALTKYGATNFANSDGTPAKNVGYGTYAMFLPELTMLAATYMYEGEIEFGLELAHRHWHNIVCEKGYTWDQPNLLRGDMDTGEAIYGHDYYQNMILWIMPAAIAGQDIKTYCASGGLVDRVIQAARS